MMAKCSGSIAIIEVSDGLTTFYQYAYNTSGTTAPTSGWSQSVPASAAGRFVWRREGTALSYDDVTSWGNEVCLTGATGATGAAGNGISSIVEYYAVSASNSTAPSSWSTSMPTLTATNKYLWNYTRYTYTDGTYVDTTKIVIGTYGDKGDTGSTGSTGVGVSSIAEKYAASSSNSTEPTSWQDTVPTLTATNRYLWNYEIFTLTNGTTTNTKKRVIGVYGDKGATGATGATGNGISSIVNYYLASASGSGITNASSGFTSSIQTLTATLKYLWNYELITYTNGTTAKSPACVIGVYGDKGATGATGPKGDKGDKGDTGASAQDFTIAASPATFTRTSRGVTKDVQTITLTCSKMNINSSVAVAWSVVGAATLSATSGESVTVTIASGSPLESFTVSCAVSGFGTKTLVVHGVMDGTAGPAYLGMFGNDEGLPTDYEGGPLITGDFFLAGTPELTVGGTTYPIATLWKYDATTESWSLDEDSADVALAFGDFSLIAQDAGTGVFSLAVIQRLIAVEVIADTIRAQSGTVKGVWASENFAENSSGVPTTGWQLDGATGTIKAVLCKFYGATIYGELYGKIKNNSIETQDGSGTAYQFSSTDLMSSKFSALSTAPTGIPDTGATMSGVLVQNPWTQIKVGSGSTAWQCVTVNASGRFVAMGGSASMAYSDDGVNWTKITVGSDDWYGVTVNSSGRFVAGGYYGSMAYSDDGVNWTVITVGSGTWYGVTVNSSGRFVAVGSAGKIAYSDDGVNWTKITVGSGYWTGVTVNASGRFVAVESAGKIAYSDDGVSWTQVTVGSYVWQCVTVNSSGRFVAGGYYGSMAYSDDGVNWTVITVGSGTWQGVTVSSSGRFVAVGYGKIAYSDDGVSWTQITVGGGTYPWYGVTVNASGRFVAVGDFVYMAYSDYSAPVLSVTNIQTTVGSDIQLTVEFSGNYLTNSKTFTITNTDTEFGFTLDAVFTEKFIFKKTVLPDASNIDLGDSVNPFQNIYANTVYGNKVWGAVAN